MMIQELFMLSLVIKHVEAEFWLKIETEWTSLTTSQLSGQTSIEFKICITNSSVKPPLKQRLVVLETLLQ